MTNKPPLIVHVIYRLGVGGLENGVVNLINHMDPSHYRHAIVCATDATSFVRRINRQDVAVYELNKLAGNDFTAQLRFWKLLRQLKPQVVHTRNMGTIEYVVPAFLAGVKYRVHGEHGRDMLDIDGTNKKYAIMRRLYAPFITRFITMSRDLERWLINVVGLPSRKIIQLYNGVDLEKFHNEIACQRYDFGLDKSDFIIGTVGRLQGEKNQSTLIQAFALLVNECSSATTIKLLIAGDGPDRTMLEQLAETLGIREHVIFMGERNDVPQLLRMFDLFVLPSLGEGISNTILEAMACGCPVVATSVGGNPELVMNDVTGYLVPAADERAMFNAIRHYFENPSLLKLHGVAGRQVVEEKFSMKAMVDRYLNAYNSLYRS